MKQVFFILTLITGFSLCVKAESFLPDNQMKRPASENLNAMTREKFFNILGKIEETYIPIVKKKHAKLIIQKMWEEDMVNAFARRMGRVYSVTIMGGIARHEKMTDDGLAMVVCHEIGHHLGGKPKSSKFLNKWSSVEGQSDYFAGLECFKKVFQSDDNIKIIENLSVPETVKERCLAHERDENLYALCMRASMAAFSASSLLGVVSFDQKDPNIVSETLENHPKPQCRLDTFLAGIFFDGSDQRPLCWFHP